MTAPQISVIVPVYNAAAHLPLLLASLLNQSEKSLEIITVDDGSTDASLLLLGEAARADARLVVLRQDNRGCSGARNRGLERARGSWIAFADSDDSLAPRTLEIWRRYAESAELDLLIGNGYCFAERPDTMTPPGVLLNRQPWDEVISGAEWIVRAVAVREWPHRAWLQLISREFVMRTDARFIEGIGHQDIPWTMRLAIAAQRVGFAREPLYAYRINPVSILNNPAKAAVVQRARSYIRVIQQLAATANGMPRRSRLRRALLRQANREGHHFLSLLRKRLQDQTVRAELARDFSACGLLRVMFQGAADEREYWEALRCWMILRWYLANAAPAT